MPDRVGTRWEGGHLEVPVGSAVAVWRLISNGGGRERATMKASGIHQLHVSTSGHYFSCYLHLITEAVLTGDQSSQAT